MIRVESVNQIMEFNKRIRDCRKGFITNLFIDATKIENWIRKNQFYYMHCSDSYLFFRTNDSFKNSFFSSVSNNKLHNALVTIMSEYPDDVFVFDIIGEILNLAETIETFKLAGLSQYTSLTRMSRIVNNPPPEMKFDCIRYAKDADLFEVKKLLYKYFDVYAEQLPDTDDLKGWIDKDHILISYDGDVINGFLIFDIVGISAYLRYWFVDPAYREKKIGSSLLNMFFYESRNAKRQYFWVIENNENAIKRYLHYGFTQESIVDYVFSNINSHYEAENNRNINRSTT